MRRLKESLWLHETMKTGALSISALVALFALAGIGVDVLDAENAKRPILEEDPPAAVRSVETISQEPVLLAEAILTPPDLYQDDIPLDRELQAALRDACESNGVPLCLMLGLIETESGFRADAVSREGCFGLCQLNPKYYPSDLSPMENLIAGTEHLAGQLERYDGDTQAALTSYNAGHDTGSRRYARAVLDASEKWGCG